MRKKRELVEFGPVIQICPDCGKVDAYKGDSHLCNREYRERRAYDIEQLYE